MNNSNTNINMNVKQMKLNVVVSRFISLLITFFMIASLDGIAETTHSVGSTENWNSAISSLDEGDVIQLTADITMGDVPSKACTITSDNGQKTLTCSSNLEMAAPLTFSNIKLDMSCIYANGHALVFDEGVECTSSYTINNGQATLAGLKNIWGGSETGSVTSTSVTLKSGTFGWVYAGGWKGSVIGEAKLDLSGSVKVNGTVFGGGDAADCGSTHIEISGGTLGYIYGGGYNGNVAGECYLKISGTPTITGNVFGGSNQLGTTVGSTHVEISGGTLGYINGGGYNGNVIGECYLKISGTPTITGNVFGGSNQLGTTVGSTRVEIAGGTFYDPTVQTMHGAIFAGGWGCTVSGNTSIVATGGTIGTIYGGCSQGSVTGSAYVEVNGATLDGGIQVDNSTPNAAAIYGSGYGDDYDADKGKVGSTRVVVKSFTPGTAGVILYGGGLYAGVTGNTDVTIENGTFGQVWGSSHTESNANTRYQGIVGGDVNILVKGGEIATLGAARDQIPGKLVPVNGKMNLTIEGGKITRQIASGNHSKGSDYKSCTLTIRNQGSESNPFMIPETHAISDIVLEGTTVAEFRKPEIISASSNALHSLIINEDHPTEISGSGKLKGDIILFNFKDGTKFANNKALVVGGEQLADAELKVYKSATTESGTVKVTTTPVYKAGDTYRSGQSDGSTTTLYTVTITHPANGKLSVVWDKVGERNTELETGDKVPDNTDLTLSVIPNEGYLGGSVLANGSAVSGTTYKVTGDVSFTVGDITGIPYTVTVATLVNGGISATPNSDVTIGTPVNLTITPEAGYRLKSGSLKVYKTGSESTVVAVSGNSFNMPAYDVTVTAEFEGIPAPPPPTPIYYTVTLPAVEGAVTDPVAGDYEVESWDSFRFYLVLDKEYDKSEPVVTTSRGETIQPRTSDGAYIIKYVRSDVNVLIEGVVKNPDPVANAEIQSGIKVWTNNHQLFIRTDQSEEISVYTFSGQLQKKFRSEAGDRFISLPSGTYIVLIGGERFKVIL